LGQHPEIHAHKVHKEPTFFVEHSQIITNPIQYFKLFDSPKRYRLDASVAYLFCPETAPVLRDLFPDARFIVTLRDPKARAYAIYRVNRRFGFEDIPSFAEALEAEDHRAAAWEFMRTCTTPIPSCFYRRSTLFDEQLARYFALFDREQFHITTLAELANHPIQTTERILRFLELDPMPAMHFDLSIKARWDDSYEPYDAQSDKIMSAQFEGLAPRVDELVGRSLDWSV
jgi:hypothetical protein